MQRNVARIKQQVPRAASSSQYVERSIRCVARLKALNGCQLGAPRSARSSCSSCSSSCVHYFASNHRQLLSERRSPTPAPPFLVTAVAGPHHRLTPTCSQIHTLIDINLLMANNESGQTDEPENCKS